MKVSSLIFAAMIIAGCNRHKERIFSTEELYRTDQPIRACVAYVHKVSESILLNDDPAIRKECLRDLIKAIDAKPIVDNSSDARINSMTARLYMLFAALEAGVYAELPFEEAIGPVDSFFSLAAEEMRDAHHGVVSKDLSFSRIPRERQRYVKCLPMYKKEWVGQLRTVLAPSSDIFRKHKNKCEEFLLRTENKFVFADKEEKQK